MSNDFFVKYPCPWSLEIGAEPVRDATIKAANGEMVLSVLDTDYFATGLPNGEARDLLSLIVTNANACSGATLPQGAATLAYVDRLQGRIVSALAQRDALADACRAFVARYENDLVDARLLFGDVYRKVRDALRAIV